MVLFFRYKNKDFQGSKAGFCVEILSFIFLLIKLGKFPIPRDPRIVIINNIEKVYIINLRMFL